MLKICCQKYIFTENGAHLLLELKDKLKTNYNYFLQLKSLFLFICLPLIRISTYTLCIP